ncbi:MULTISPECIES: hypothetical protein [Alistipes]|uniref:hypothetical protein n=1 Tax=Alistipes TaxID=239759 RepID=UPI001B397A66|nr:MULTISPECIES: hypothetical protein [Alistipes]MBQ4902718.1 hypothetical protein [Alistipes sp. Marseille-P2263]MBS5643826.1 hypothetical protein [Alistipes sp.]MCI2258475.1 hypothetical protein [Alistipes dispar]
MKHILLRALAVALACGACASVSCGGNASTKAKTRQTEAARPAALEIDELLASADSLAGKTVTIEGVCTHTCRHGARKIFLMGSDDTQTVRVESGELGSFDPQCVNRIVRVTGTLDEQRVDEAYLAAWEEQTKAQTGERHGTTEAGCDAEKAARQETGATVAERIADFRAKIAARKAAEGKDYLSFYYVTATSYEIEQ